MSDLPLTAEYFACFLDAELNHSSGYFTGRTRSLDEAQRRKLDHLLEACDIRSGSKLLDVGCGFGSALRRATELNPRLHAYGITVRPEEIDYLQKAPAMQHPRIDVRLESWETFTEPVDRIICINAFENLESKSPFFAHCRSLLPPTGRMVMLTVTADRPLFRVISREAIESLAREASFDVECSPSLAEHYIRTMELFIRNLEERRDKIIAVASQDVLERAIAYYTQSARFLRDGLNDLYEFRFHAR